VEPFRFGVDSAKAHSRKRVGAVLVTVAVVVPVLFAVPLESGANGRWWSALAVWAIGAMPGLGAAALGARKPRTADVVGGYAIGVALVVGAAYITAFALDSAQ
jgi:hypothetical protein